jgi:hypothetical protein
MPRIFVKLANPQHVLPNPERGGLPVPQDRPFTVDPSLSFWAQCLADGSVVAVSEPAPDPAPAKPAEKPAKEKP